MPLRLRVYSCNFANFGTTLILEAMRNLFTRLFFVLLLLAGAGSSPAQHEVYLTYKIHDFLEPEYAFEYVENGHFNGGDVPAGIGIGYSYTASVYAFGADIFTSNQYYQYRNALHGELHERQFTELNAYVQRRFCNWLVGEAGLLLRGGHELMGGDAGLARPYRDVALQAGIGMRKIFFNHLAVTFLPRFTGFVYRHAQHDDGVEFPLARDVQQFNLIYDLRLGWRF